MGNFRLYKKITHPDLEIKLDVIEEGELEDAERHLGYQLTEAKKRIKDKITKQTKTSFTIEVNPENGENFTVEYYIE